MIINLLRNFIEIQFLTNHLMKGIGSYGSSQHNLLPQKAVTPVEKDAFGI